MNAKIMILEIMLTTQLPIHVVLTLPLTLKLPKVFNCFDNNHMKANPGKCHLSLSTKSPEVVSIDGIQITSSTAETLLGITINSELNFENHLCAM